MVSINHFNLREVLCRDVIDVIFASLPGLQFKIRQQACLCVPLLETQVQVLSISNWYARPFYCGLLVCNNSCQFPSWWKTASPFQILWGQWHYSICTVKAIFQRQKRQRQRICSKCILSNEELSILLISLSPVLMFTSS